MVFPTPASNQITLHTTQYTNGIHHLCLVDFKGRNIRDFNFLVTAGTGELIISVKELPVGMYAIIGLNESIKFIVQHLNQ